MATVSHVPMFHFGALKTVIVCFARCFVEKIEKSHFEKKNKIIFEKFFGPSSEF